MTSQLDAVRVSQIRSISFAQGEIRTYANNGGAITAASSSDEAADETNRFIQHNGAGRSVDSSSKETADGDGVAPLGPLRLMHDGVSPQTSGGFVSTNGSFGPRAAAATAAFSPLTASERQHAQFSAVDEGSADPPDLRAPRSHEVGEGRESRAESSHLLSSENGQRTYPSMGASQSIVGPSPPTQAFVTDESVLAKFASLASYLVFFLQTTSNPETRSRLAPLHLNKPRGAAPMASLSKPVTLSENPGSGPESPRAQEQSTIVVMVTPRGSQPPLPHASSAAALELHSTVNHRLQQSSAMAPPTTSAMLLTLVRECVAEFPRLLHLMEANSAYKLTHSAALEAVLGRKRSPALAQHQPHAGSAFPATAATGAPSATTHATLYRTSGDGNKEFVPTVENSRFSVALRLAEAFLQIFSGGLVRLSTEHSSESNARLDIAFQHIMERWSSAVVHMQSSFSPADANDLLLIPARPSRAVSAAASTSMQAAVATPVMTASEELIQLALEWSRLASASRGTSGGIAARRPSAGSALVPPFLFDVSFDSALCINDSSESWVAADGQQQKGRIPVEERAREAPEELTALGSYTFERLDYQVSPAAMLDDSSTWKQSVVQLVLWVTNLVVVCAAGFGALHWTAVGVVVLILSAFGFVHALWSIGNRRRDLRAQKWAVFLTGALAAAAPVLTSLPLLITTAATGSSGGAAEFSAALRAQQPSAASNGAGGSSSAHPGSAMASTFAVSTPSPLPSHDASVMADAFVVKTGNQTPMLVGEGGGGPALFEHPGAASLSKGPHESSLLSGVATTTMGTSSKKPNPLTAEALLTSQEAASADDDDTDVVRVRMDPTGTFLVPFLDKEPILLDGVHIHRHLTIMGVEFTRRPDESQSKSAAPAAAGDSMVLGDNAQDEDRYTVCMWNWAMTEATGGYTAQQIVEQSLAQVVADVSSYTALVAAIRGCEEAVAASSSAVLSTDPLLIRVVHKELGSRSVRVTISPVMRFDEDAAAQSLSAFGEARQSCIGVLITGVPVDSQAELRAYSFRSTFLTEVLEETLAEFHLQLCAANAAGAKATPTVTPAHRMVVSPKRDSSSGIPAASLSPFGQSLVSPMAAPSFLPPVSAVQLGARKINEYFIQKAIQALSSVASFSDEKWRAVYTNFIPGILSKAFPKFPIRTRVESSTPSIVQVSLEALTRVIDQILNTLPMSSSITADNNNNNTTATPSLGARHASAVSAAFTITSQELQTSFIKIIFGITSEESASMFCRIENVPAERYIEMVVNEIQMEDATGVTSGDSSGSALALLRAADAKLIVHCSQDPPLARTDVTPTTTMAAATVADSAEGNLVRASSSMHSTAAESQAAITRFRAHTLPGSGSLTQRDCVTILFPFRVQSGATAAISAWEMREKRVGTATSTPSSVETSLRDLASPAIAAGARPSSGDPLATGETVVLSVVIDALNELDRQKYTRRFWEDHHSVFPLEGGGKFLTRGLKLLRSHCRTFDIAILDFPSNMSESEFEKRMEDVAKEFPETSFVLLRPKKARRRSVGPPLPLHPSAAPSADRKPSALISFFAPPEPKPSNLHVVPKVGTQQGVTELVQYATSRALAVRKEQQRKVHLQQVFRAHRSGPWTRGKKLGRGTFGDVFEACVTLTGAKMAVKTIRLPSSDPQRMEQLINEVEILSRVQHPNIVQYFYCEAGSTANEMNIFMELCAGGSLQSKCQSLAPPDLSQVSVWVQQLCSALAYLHLNHLAHRDIKPANLLLNESNVVKMADFGTATSALRPLKEMAGTFAYMAPEVYAGNDYGTPCDIWSVGGVLLDLLGKETCTRTVGSSSSGLSGGYFSSCTTDEEIWARIDANVADAVVADFLKQCFRLDPLSRSTAEQLLMHPFLANRARQSSPGTIPRRASTLAAQQRRSHESSVGALSVDSGDFGKSTSGWDDDDDDSGGSDDGWGDVVRGAGDSDAEEPSREVPKRRQNPHLETSASSAVAFTPSARSTPSPSSRPKNFVAESPSAHKRRVLAAQASLTQIPDGVGSPVFATNAAAVARRQSNAALRTSPGRES